MRRNPANVERLKKAYAAWHWGAPAKKLIRVDDPMVPDVIACGELRYFELGQGGNVVFKFPVGSWIAYDPSHPHERLHVITPKSFREQVRNEMKHARETMPLQEIAEEAGGTQCRYPLPNIHGAPLGLAWAVVYHTYKEGEEGGEAEYIHAFGHEHSKGVRPILAADVSGRVWLVGGSYLCPLAGITG